MNENILRLILPSKNPCRTAKNSIGDGDREIILPIVILLLAERCDFFLIFALLYILM
ncbi:MAG: hypothetical protein IJE19_07040 [Clostridia bacterium]|nr:hypothetical protein [Clostridia bacterium]